MLASPGDVQEERDIIAEVIDLINLRLRDDHSVILELWRWETDTYPGFHALGPQGQVDENLRIEEADVLVGVFAKRLGTPVHDSDSGTVHEIGRALSARKATGSPQIMLYFKEEEFHSQSDVEQRQYEAVRNYRAELSKAEPLSERPLLWDYSNIKEFRNSADIHLWKCAVTFAKLPRTVPSKYSGLLFELVIEPIVVRSEGQAELMGNIYIDCRHEGSTPSVLAFFSLDIYVNTVITSPEVVLFEVGRSGATTFISTKPLGNTLHFSGISLTGLRPDEVRRFQIANLRCVSSFGPIALTAVATDGPFSTRIETLATVSRGLEFTVIPLTGPNASTVIGHDMTSPLTHVATLRFAEGFPHAFKTRFAGQVAGNRSGEIIYTGESCRFGSVIDHADGVRFSGLADHGTEVCAAFRDIPVGLRVFVVPSGTLGDSDHPLSAIGMFEIVESISTLLPKGERVGRFGIQVRELLVQNGTALACWELTQMNPQRRPGACSVTFHIFILEAATVPRRAFTVNGSFYPVPTFGTYSPTNGIKADASLPVPRFVDTSSRRSISLPG